MSDVLPTSGPLGERINYEPTNIDLLQNAYLQNRTLNEMKSEMSTMKNDMAELKNTVRTHDIVIHQINQLKAIGVCIASFVGLGGLIQLLELIRNWAHIK